MAKINENNKKIIKVSYAGSELELCWSDLWFISYIRKLGFGKLSHVQIQDGKVVLVEECEKKIKPKKPETEHETA